MKCPACGNDNPDGASFCKSCGSSLANNTGTYSSVPSPGSNPSQNSNGMPYSGGIEKRNIPLYVILSIVTCGIFAYVWIYKLTEDMNQLDRDPNATSGGIVILLAIVTCGIYMFFWLYKQGERLDRVKAMRGMPSSNLAVLYLVLGFISAIISMALMQDEINRLV